MIPIPSDITIRIVNFMNVERVSGVYLIHNERVLYVGKSNHLLIRAISHFGHVGKVTTGNSGSGNRLSKGLVDIPNKKVIAYLEPDPFLLDVLEETLICWHKPPFNGRQSAYPTFATLEKTYTYILKSFARRRGIEPYGLPLRRRKLYENNPNP